MPKPRQADARSIEVPIVPHPRGHAAESSKTKFSLVLPAFNECDSLPAALARCSELAETLAERLEVIIVDDGSTDGTIELLRTAEANHPWLSVIRHETNFGYGSALRSGFAAASGDVVAYSDADNQIDFLDFVPYVDYLDAWDLVAGYRANRLDPPLRRWVSSAYNALARFLFGVRIRDVNCSFKLMKRERLQRLCLLTSDFFIDTELVARAKRDRWRIVEVPVEHYPRVAGESTVKPGDVPRTIIRMVSMWFRFRLEQTEANSSTPEPQQSTNRVSR